MTPVESPEERARMMAEELDQLTGSEGHADAIERVLLPLLRKIEAAEKALAEERACHDCAEYRAMLQRKAPHA